MEDLEIVEAMIRYGGSFVQQLGKLWQHGDRMNRAKVKAAFPDYWKEYTRVAELARQRKSGVVGQESGHRQPADVSGADYDGD